MPVGLLCSLSTCDHLYLSSIEVKYKLKFSSSVSLATFQVLSRTCDQGLPFWTGQMETSHHHHRMSYGQCCLCVPLVDVFSMSVFILKPSSSWDCGALHKLREKVSHQVFRGQGEAVTQGALTTRHRVLRVPLYPHLAQGILRLQNKCGVYL